MSASKISKRLKQAGCRFYHAINLRAFAAYINGAAILSRKQLKATDPGTTPFWSDEGDERRGVMDRVYGNLYDFGRVFSVSNKEGSPNIYGPITLVMSPSAFDEMSDIVITKRSVVSLEGNWRGHAVDEVGLDALLAGDAYGSPIAREYQFCEISTATNALPLDALECVIVEPLEFDGLLLEDEVKRLVSGAGLTVPVKVRQYNNVSHRDLLREIAASLCGIYHAKGASQVEFKIVPGAIASMDRRYQRRFETWMTYLYFDSICYLRGESETIEKWLWERDLSEWRGRAAAYFELGDDQLKELAGRGKYDPKHNVDTGPLECGACGNESIVVMAADIGVCTNLDCREVLRLRGCDRCGEVTGTALGELCANCEGYFEYLMDQD